MDRLLAAIADSSSDDEEHEVLSMPLFQQLDLRGLADPAQIAKMQANVRSGRFSMAHYEAVWAPKLAQVGSRPAPSAATAPAAAAPTSTMSLFQKLDFHGLAEQGQIANMQANVRDQTFTMEHYEAVWAPKLAQLGLGPPAQRARALPLFTRLELYELVPLTQIAKMRQNVRDGRFTVEHYEAIWSPKLALYENQMLGRQQTQTDAPSSISAQIQQERARALAAKSSASASARALSESERELDVVEQEAEALAHSLIARMPELVQLGLAGSRQKAVWCGNIP